MQAEFERGTIFVALRDEASVSFWLCSREFRQPDRSTSKSMGKYITKQSAEFFFFFFFDSSGLKTSTSRTIKFMERRDKKIYGVC